MSYQKKQIQQLNSEEEKRAESVYKKAIVISGLLLGPTLLDLKQVEELKATGITVGHFTCVKSEDDTKDVLPDI